jgi:hypothetical protein
MERIGQIAINGERKGKAKREDLGTDAWCCCCAVVFIQN